MTDILRRQAVAGGPDIWVDQDDSYRPPLDTIIQSVKFYGATGDGVTDDTASIQAAIDAAGEEQATGEVGGIVFFPPGIYVISSPLVLRAYVTLRGSGQWATTIKQTTADTTVIVAEDSTNRLISVSFNYAGIHDMTLWGANSVNPLGDDTLGFGFEFTADTGSNFFRMTNVYITGTGNCGVHVVPTSDVMKFQWATFDSVMVESRGWTISGDYAVFNVNGSGFHFEGAVNGCTFNNCQAQGTKGYGWRFIQASDDGRSALPTATLLSNCVAEASGRDSTDRVDGIYITGCDGFVMNGGYTEDNGYSDSTDLAAAIYIGAHNCAHIVIDGVRFAYFHVGVDAYRGRDIRIENCSFDWDGSTPATAPTAIKVQTGVVSYSVVLGKNVMYPDAENADVTYLDETGSKVVGWKESPVNSSHTTAAQTFTVPYLGIEPIKMTCATAPPGSGTWAKGDILWNYDPANGEPAGWICTAAGTPGTWSKFGTIEAV